MSVENKINNRLLQLSNLHLRMMHLHQKGFTLIELLVVIGIVGILLSITLVAINPARQFRLANDADRRGDINTLSSAITQLLIDNKGAVPTNLSVIQGATYYSIYSNHNSASVSLAFGSLCQYLTGQVSLNTVIGLQTYISKLPADPATGYGYTDCTSFNLGYSVKISNGRVFVTSRQEEPIGTFEVSR